MAVERVYDPERGEHERRVEASRLGRWTERVQNELISDEDGDLYTQVSHDPTPTSSG